MRVTLRTLHKGLAAFAALAAIAGLSGRTTSAQESDIAPAMCVRGFSKLVEGTLSGPWTTGGCADGICRTAQSEAGLVWSVKNNPSLCDPTAGATCDESPLLEGRLTAKVKVNVRGQRPCPYRGAYEGVVELRDVTGVLAGTGRLQATLGVGTHQKPCVGATCPARCETCYDVNYALNSWRFGTEGLIDVPITAGRYAGCRVRASLQGDFQTGWGGPFATPWQSKGNLDGVLECPCYSTLAQ
jgi:hypothetical protein